MVSKSTHHMRLAIAGLIGLATLAFMGLFVYLPKAEVTAMSPFDTPCLEAVRIREGLSMPLLPESKRQWWPEVDYLRGLDIETSVGTGYKLYMTLTIENVSDEMITYLSGGYDTRFHVFDSSCKRIWEQPGATLQPILAVRLESGQQVSRAAELEWTGIQWMGSATYYVYITTYFLGGDYSGGAERDELRGSPLYVAAYRVRR